MRQRKENSRIVASGRGKITKRTSRLSAVRPDGEDRGLSAYDRELAQKRTARAKFRADSALLKELGERLVGRPYVALAELVKNAYDADATRCTIDIESDRIVVADNGHGMEKPEFLEYWMTIGTRNKERQGFSRLFKRPVTGSKGVGRLAAQFLAHRMQLVTTSKRAGTERLHAFVDWDDAIDSGSLTEAVAKYRTEPNDAGLYPGRSRSGTVIVMERLKQDWNDSEIGELGRQIWMLNAPVPNFGKTKSRQRSGDDFRIQLRTKLPGIDERFERQMRQALENNQATIRGAIVRKGAKTVSQVTVSFDDGETFTQEFEQLSYLSEASWEIRVYDLSGRQTGGVSVVDMRKYFEKYGGVMVYDAGFRLPYYGAANDWLNLEFDHSHRRSRSELLPEHLQVSRALNDLPTQGRIYGIVNVDTGQEQRVARQRQRDAGEYLKIQVSRDRLVGNKAYGVLQRAVRQSLDYYASLKRQRTLAIIDFERPREAAVAKVSRLTTLLRELRARYPNDETVRAVEIEISDLDARLEKEGRSEEAVRGLLGPLASTGMIALAMEHETRKEVRAARSSIRTLRRMAKDLRNDELQELAGRLTSWVDRLEGTRRILQPMMDAEDRLATRRLLAAPVVRSAIENAEPFLGNVPVVIKAAPDIRLPAATLTEWHSIIQNVLLNAVNATLDCPDPRIKIDIYRQGRWAFLDISDNGVGVDLEEKDVLFRPFERRSKISDERRELGLGGTGLGLTIVEMIASQRDCFVDFVEPEDGWSTTFEMTWKIGENG